MVEMSDRVWHDREQKAFKRGYRCRADARQIINNVKIFFEEQKKIDVPLKVDNVTNLVAKATGVSKNSVIRIAHEGKENDGVFASPKRRYQVSRDRIMVDQFDRAAIRNTIHDFFVRKEYPTISKVLTEVHDKGIFMGGRTSLRKIIRQLGFKHKQINDRKCVVEQLRVVMQRHSYLRAVKQHRNDGWNLIYLDETWLNAHHHLKKCWTDVAVNVKSGKGERLIINSSCWMGRGMDSKLL